MALFAVDDDRRRQLQILRHDAEELPVQRQMHDAVVGAIAGDEARRLKRVSIASLCSVLKL
jgi:hypothetical protein